MGEDATLAASGAAKSPAGPMRWRASLNFRLVRECFRKSIAYN